MKLLPVHEIAQDPEFEAFWNDLMENVRTRDGAGLVSKLGRTAMTLPNDSGSPEEFIDTYHPYDPTSPMWDTLATIMALGGAFVAPDGFVVPYVAANWLDDRSPFDHHATYEVITVSPAPLRAEPDEHAPIVGDASYEFIRQGDRVVRPTGLWVEAETDDGLIGWLPRSWFRHPMDWAMTIARDQITNTIGITAFYSETGD